MSGSGQLQTAAPDHPHHTWRPFPSRPAMRYCGGQTLGLCPIIAFESHEDRVPDDWPQPHWLTGGVGIRPDPNIARIGQRDYGLRAGWPRLRQALRNAKLSYGAAIDVLTAERCPALVAQIAVDVADGCAEWIAHGISINRPLFDGMEPAAEEAYLLETQERLGALDVKPRGWFGPEYSESRRTPPLLAKAGFSFTLDWCNDEQPFAMTVPDGALTALPQMADLDDAFAFAFPRGITPQSYASRIAQAARGLAKDGRTSARVMVWTMRPFLSGQPFRIGAIEAALLEASRTGGVFSAPPSVLLDQLKPEKET